MKKNFRKSWISFLKNILIRAVKTGKPHEIKELDACEKFLGVDPLLGRLRKEKGEM